MYLCLVSRGDRNVLRDSKMIFFRAASYVAANDNDNAARWYALRLYHSLLFDEISLRLILAIPGAIWQMFLPPLIKFLFA